MIYIYVLVSVLCALPLCLLYMTQRDPTLSGAESQFLGDLSPGGNRGRNHDGWTFSMWNFIAL